jgi:hypothetical protein
MPIVGQVGTFTDNTSKHIIALDFDGTITTRNEFPRMGRIRPFAKDVINLLHDLGAVVVIWTCRDYHHIPTLERWLHDNGIRYSSINSSIEYAPFEYEARKIYAHMYVDDRGFGWREHKYVMLEVMHEFMRGVMGIPKETITNISDKIYKKEDVDIVKLKNYLHGRGLL